MIDVKNSPFFAPTMESFGEKSAKMGLTEFSRVPAYIPKLARMMSGPTLRPDGRDRGRSSIGVDPDFHPVFVDDWTALGGCL